MANRLMARQESLGLEIPQSVAVVGCGGVGSWTAYLLALAGVPEIWLFDKDTISDHNLNRIPLPLSEVDKQKSVAVAEWIQKIRPDCNLLPLGLFTAKTAKTLDLANKIIWVVATTDTLASRKEVAEWAVKNGVFYMEAAAEGETGSATGQPAEWNTPEENQPGYASVPVHCIPCVLSAAIAVDYVIHGKEMGTRTVRLGWEDSNFASFIKE